MITHPRVNRGLVPEAADSGPVRLIVLVQAKDAEGFWCNVHEAPTVAHGKAYAQAWASLHGVDARVVRGPKRELVKAFYGAPDTMAQVESLASAARSLKRKPLKEKDEDRRH